MDTKNQKILRRLILEWQQPVYNLAYRMLGNEADAADATQDIFTRVIANIDKFDRNRAFRPWLFRIAKNYRGNRMTARHRGMPF